VSVATLEPANPQLFEAVDPVDSGLDRLLVGLWEALTSHRSVACPICGAHMRPEYGVRARPGGGRCEECGCTLS
jgi:hypothetical protein